MLVWQTPARVRQTDKWRLGLQKADWAKVYKRGDGPAGLLAYSVEDRGLLSGKTKPGRI